MVLAPVAPVYCTCNLTPFFRLWRVCHWCDPIAGSHGAAGNCKPRQEWRGFFSPIADLYSDGEASRSSSV